MKISFVRPLFTALTALFCLTAIAQHSIDLQGHRGGRWLLPENTLAAFQRAMQLGARTIEVDFCATKDDVLVISHYPVLNPDITRDAQGRSLSSMGPAIITLNYSDLLA